MSSNNRRQAQRRSLDQGAVFQLPAWTEEGCNQAVTPRPVNANLQSTFFPVYLKGLQCRRLVTAVDIYYSLFYFVSMAMGYT